MCNHRGQYLWLWRSRTIRVDNIKKVNKSTTDESTHNMRSLLPFLYTCIVVIIKGKVP